MSDQEDYKRVAGREQETEPPKKLDAIPLFHTFVFVLVVIAVGGLIAAGAVWLVEAVFTALGL